MEVYNVWNSWDMLVILISDGCEREGGGCDDAGYAICGDKVVYVGVVMLQKSCLGGVGWGSGVGSSVGRICRLSTRVLNLELWCGVIQSCGFNVVRCPRPWSPIC